MSRSLEQVVPGWHSTVGNISQWLQEIPTVLVSKAEHQRLSEQAIPASVSKRLYTMRPTGLNWDRYHDAGVRVAKMTSTPASPDDLYLPS